MLYRHRGAIAHRLYAAPYGAQMRVSWVFIADDLVALPHPATLLKMVEPESLGLIMVDAVTLFCREWTEPIVFDNDVADFFGIDVCWVKLGSPDRDGCMSIRQLLAFAESLSTDAANSVADAVVRQWRGREGQFTALLRSLFSITAVNPDHSRLWQVAESIEWSRTYSRATMPHTAFRAQSHLRRFTPKERLQGRVIVALCKLLWHRTPISLRVDLGLNGSNWLPLDVMPIEQVEALMVIINHLGQELDVNATPNQIEDALRNALPRHLKTQLMTWKNHENNHGNECIHDRM